MVLVVMGTMMKCGVWSYLIMQHKSYIIELSFMKTQKSHDSINEGPSLTTEGPPQTNVVYVPMSHLGQNLGLISNYILPIPVIQAIL